MNGRINVIQQKSHSCLLGGTIIDGNVNLIALEDSYFKCTLIAVFAPSFKISLVCRILVQIFRVDITVTSVSVLG